MSPRNLLFFSLAGALWADSQFTVRRMTRTDVPSGKGQCDVRLRIDGEAEVELRGERVIVRTISGAEARDEGSECNLPVPRLPQNVRFEKRDGRGEMSLLGETRRGAIVGIRDKDGGAGRYHFRLSWDDTGTSRDDVFDDRPNRPNRQGGIFDDNRPNRPGGVYDDNRPNRQGGIFDDNRPNRPGVYDDNPNGRVGGNLSRSLQGDGDLRYRGRTDRLRQATIDMRRGGRFTLSVDGDTRETFEGTWRQGRRNEIELMVDRTRNARATGHGTVLLRGNEVRQITLDAREDRGGERIDLTFRSNAY